MSMSALFRKETARRAEEATTTGHSTYNDVTDLRLLFINDMIVKRKK